MSDNEHSNADSDGENDSVDSVSNIEESEFPDDAEEVDINENDDDIPIEDGELDEIDAIEDNMSDAGDGEENMTASIAISPAEGVFKKKYTNSYMTKYEFTHMIGVRAAQIEDGSQVLVQTDKVTPVEIAIAELEEKQIPLIIRRTIKISGKNTHEDWRVDEFENIQILINHYK
jgi:DNA-directed RNA polymerase subunit K/omega